MHFAYPPRKSSNPPPFRPRSSRLSQFRRTRLRTVLLVLGGLLFGIYLLSGRWRRHGTGPYQEYVPTGSPPVVIVTVVDPFQYGEEYIKTIQDNRELYAKKHGYETMVMKSYFYDTLGSPSSWAKIMAMRHAITKYPNTNLIWYLDQNAYIMDPTKSVEEHVSDTKRLESLMMKDFPVVPPDSIIKTFSHLRGTETDLILTQDRQGLVSDSLIVRNGDWAKFFLETWFDPLYRNYNFQRAERHALEHIVQWHPTILSRLALIPQRTIASYTRIELGESYQDGDFVVVFPGCPWGTPAACEAESKQYEQRWKANFGVAS